LKNHKQFKQTEIERIPKDWEMIRIGEILTLKNGERPVAIDNGNFPIYGANGVMGYTSNILVDNDFTIVIGRVGASGEIHLVEGKAWISDNAIYSESYDKNKIYSPLLFYLLKFKKLSQFASKTTHSIITQSFLNSFLVPLPSLPEQKKIAEILSTVDQGIEKVSEAIEKTQKLKKGLMQELLTGKRNIVDGRQGKREFKLTEIERIPKEWEVAQLKEVVEINRDSVDPTKEFPNKRFLYIDIDSVENETGFITKAKEILGKDAPSRARRVIHNNDILMSTVRPYLKAFAIVPKRFHGQICSTGFAVLTCSEKIYSPFLFYTLFKGSVIDQCNRMMVGGQYPALNSSQVERIKIPIPPVAEQKKIAEILSTVDKRLEWLRNRKEKLGRIKKGLMNDLLTGKKRVNL
jgi:type I restriction enzyme S subunit